MAETPQDIVNRVFREFKRFTGDGLPTEPVGAPLPVGDPASGVWNPRKSDLREALLAPVEDAEESASEARNWANEDEDVVVADGEYSAKHYSAKAADSATEAANQVAGVIPSIQRFAVGDAVQSVDLGNPELHPNSVRVFIDGVYQFSDTWSITDGVITPVGGTWPGDGVPENMEVVIDATSAAVFGVPSNGSVSRDKIAEEAVGLDAIGSDAIYTTDTPFGRSGVRVLLGQNNDAHYGLNSAILDAGGGKWVIVYRKGAAHGVRNGAEIRAVDTFDGGATLQNDRLLYTNAGYDTRNFVGRVMANGRLGIIAIRRVQGGAYLDPIFIYSDDAGGNWATSIVEAPSAGYVVNFHGSMIDFPTSVGGADEGGFIAYSYGHTGGHVDALHTVDNGDTWTWETAVASPSVPVSQLSEMACSRIGAEDKWVMFCRVVGQDNAVAFTSADPLDFGAQVDTGVQLTDNPPQTLYDPATGRLWFMAFFRRTRGLVVGDATIENCFALIGGDGGDIYDAGGDLLSLGLEWGVAGIFPDWAAGYIHPFLLNGRWFGTFVMGEEHPWQTYSKLALLGDFVATNIDSAKLAHEYARDTPVHGFYTPTLTHTTNIASSEALQCQYTREGRNVRVWGTVNVVPAISGNISRLALSLPIPSDLDSVRDLAGSASSGGSLRDGRVTPNMIDNLATISFTPDATDGGTFSFNFNYLVW